MQTRRANFSDLLEMQHCNLRCLPENYNLRYYLYHYLSWPELLHVTHDYNNNVCGYVLSKLDDEEEEAKVHGHVTSLAVLRTQRKKGIASQVMQKSLDQMEKMTDGSYCSLHVRRTNEAALHLYQSSLGFRCWEVDAGYYVDGEDAFHMKKFLGGRPQQGSIVNPDGTLTRIPGSAPIEETKKGGATASHSGNNKGGNNNNNAAAAKGGNSGNTQKGGSTNANTNKDAGNKKGGNKKDDAKDIAAAAAAAAAKIEAESSKGKKGGNNKKK